MWEADEPKDRLLERAIILNTLLEQSTIIITALLARCGGEATLTKEELDFVRKTYESMSEIKGVDGDLVAVSMKLKLK